MAGYSSASLAIGVLFSDCITKDTPPPFKPPSTTFDNTPTCKGQDELFRRLSDYRITWIRECDPAFAADLPTAVTGLDIIRAYPSREVGSERDG